MFLQFKSVFKEKLFGFDITENPFKCPKVSRTVTLFVDKTGGKQLINFNY